METKYYYVVYETYEDGILKSKNALIIYKGPMIHYLNKIYRSLILEDDEFIVNKFNEMVSIMNHSKICLLKMVSYIISEMLNQIERHDLDISAYNNFMINLNEKYNNLGQEIKLKLVNNIGHQCEGEDIKKCDPNIPMFT